MQVLGIGVHALGAAHVRSGQREGVLALFLELLEDGQEVIAGIQVVHRKIEEALDLVRMQVAGHEGVGSGHLEHVGDQLCADGDARLVLAVLAGPAIIRDDGDDFVGRCTLGCVDAEQQFHQVVAAGKSALDNEAGGATDTFLVRGLKFAVAEMGTFQRSKNHIGVLRTFHTVHGFHYLLREIAGGITCKKRHPVLMDIVYHNV